MTAMKRLTCLILVTALGLAATPIAQTNERIDDAVIARLKVEGFQHSQVMTTLSWLSDVHGPRLTGSPALRRAGEWARDEMARWGLKNTALESYGPVGRGWTVERFDIAMTAPQWTRIIGYPRAFSPSIPAPIAGTPILVEVKSKDDFEKYRGKLKGAIVMNGRPAAAELSFEPEAKRLTDADLAKKGAEIHPGSDGEPNSYWDEEADWLKTLDKQKEILTFFASEGIAALVEPSSSLEAVRVGGFYDHVWRATFPGFVIAREQYGRMVRLIDMKQPVTLSLSLAATFSDAADGFNVIAEIPGTDPALRSEVVMLGGHLDSWHTGTGATDNAAGCAVAMEAMRMLQTIGIRPRRTIRLALWTGEEQDYFGSMGYVTKHFGDPKTMALKPEHATLAAYFNLDNGGGRIRGVNLQGNEAARSIFEAWLRPFAYLGASTLTTLNSGGTDHMSFDAVGLPGFQFIQDPLNYDTRTHHTNLDVYEQVVPADMEQAAVILASVVYHAATRDAMMPRKALPKARSRF
jgi:carboxypeptidase Q